MYTHMKKPTHKNFVRIIELVDVNKEVVVLKSWQ